MGGLVARLVLEDDQYRTAPWIKKVTLFLGICNPHHGAPQALDAGSSGIDAADMPTVTSNLSYPQAIKTCRRRTITACANSQATRHLTSMTKQSRPDLV